jgi:fatty acid desaturase
VKQPNVWAPASLASLSQYSNQTINYGAFRDSIPKNYFSNCFPFISSWLGIGGVSAVLIKTTFIPGVFGLLWLVMAVLIYVLLIHRLLLLVHEGAHLHFSKSRKLNDFITNSFAGVFLGSEVSTYRKIHTLHHRQIGTSSDPENSYENEFDFSWVATVLSGFYTFKTMFKRSKVTQPKSQVSILFLSLAIHSLVLIFSALNGFWLFFTTWGISWFLLMPALAATRNLLEHRYTESDMHLELQDSLVGFKNVTTRLFTQSVLSKIFGPIGFDRHVLHHWDPSIPAKDLKKVHDFLATTELKPMLDILPSTYYQAARTLWREKR